MNIYLKKKSSIVSEMKIESLEAKANIMYLNGNLRESLNTILEGENILNGKTDETSKYWKARLLCLKGSIYDYYGDLNKALNYQLNSISIKNEIEDNQGIAISLERISSIYQQKNDLSQALEYLLKARDMYANLKFTTIRDTGKVDVLFEIVLIYLQLDDVEEASFYSDELETIADNYSGWVHASNRNRLIKASFLKKSNRLRNRAKAFDIFENVIQQKNIDYKSSIFAMVNLCELLIEELNQFGDPEVLKEIHDITDRFYKTAKNQNAYPLLVEILLLNANIALVETKFDNAIYLLEQALKIAEENKLFASVEKVKFQKEKFYENFKNWEELLTKGNSLRDRLNQSNIKQYIDEALEIMNLARNKGYK